MFGELQSYVSLPDDWDYTLEAGGRPERFEEVATAATVFLDKGRYSNRRIAEHVSCLTELEESLRRACCRFRRRARPLFIYCLSIVHRTVPLFIHCSSAHKQCTSRSARRSY